MCYPIDLELDVIVDSVNHVWILGQHHVLWPTCAYLEVGSVALLMDTVGRPKLSVRKLAYR